MRGLTRDTLAEFFDRHVIWLFAGVTVIAILIIILSGKATMSFQMHTQGDLDLGSMDDFLGSAVVRGLDMLMTVLVFLAVMATAGLIPRMLQRGQAEFYLSKPLSRPVVYLGRLVGIWFVYGLTVVICGAVASVVAGLVHDIFDVHVLYLLLMSMISLAIWLSITGVVGLMSGSASLSITIAFLVWILQKSLDTGNWLNQLIRTMQSESVNGLLDILYYIFPKTSAISEISVQLALGRTVDDWMPLWSSLLFAIAMLYTAVWSFKRKNY